MRCYLLDFQEQKGKHMELFAAFIAAKNRSAEAAFVSLVLENKVYSWSIKLEYFPPTKERQIIEDGIVCDHKVKNCII